MFFERESREEKSRQANYLVKLLKIAKNIEPFKGKKAEEIFSNEETKRDFIEKTDEKDYLTLLDNGNKIIKNKMRDGWEGHVEMNGVIRRNRMTYISPIFEEDKKEVISESLSLAKKMNRDGRDLKDIGVVLTIGAYEAHMYSDGNTRTSLLPYLMLVADFEKKDDRREIEKIISNNREFWIDFDVLNEKAYEDIRGDILDETTENIYRLTNRFDLFSHIASLTEKESDFKKINESVINVINSDEQYSILALLKYFKDNDKKAKDYLDSTDISKNARKLDLAMLVKDFDQEGIEKFLKIYRGLKVEMAKRAINTAGYLVK